MRLTTLLGLGIGTALLGKRVQQIADREGRPLSDVLADLPARIAQDLRTFPEDLRMAADEARLAAERRAHEVDEELDSAFDADPVPDV